MTPVQLPEVPAPIGHLHSDDDFCRTVPVYPELWPVDVYTAAQLREYATEAVMALLSGECHWVNRKPSRPGVYGVRGYQYGVSKEDQFEAVVMVKRDGDELVCNMHECNTSEEIEDWGLVSDISDKFEWCEFIPAPAIAPSETNSER